VFTFLFWLKRKYIERLSNKTLFSNELDVLKTDTVLIKLNLTAVQLADTEEYANCKGTITILPVQNKLMKGERQHNNKYTEQDVTNICVQVIDSLDLIDYFRDFKNLVSL